MSDWSSGRRKGFITSVIRKGFTRWPPKYEVLNAAKRGKRTNVSTGRIAEHYQCNACKKEFPSREVEVDHINPVVSNSGFSTWDEFINNLFCEASNLQVICKDCHKKKSKLENEERKKNKL